MASKRESALALFSEVKDFMSGYFARARRSKTWIMSAKYGDALVMTPIVTVTHVWRLRYVYVYGEHIDVSVMFTGVIRDSLRAVTPQPTSRIPTIAFLPPPALYNCVASQPVKAFSRALIMSTSASCGAALHVLNTPMFMQVKMGQHKAATPW